MGVFITPAHRKLAGLIELSGAFAKDPQRRRPIGSKSSEPIGDSPSCLAPDEAAAWSESVHCARLAC